MPTTLFSHPPSFDAIKPILRQLGVWLLAFSNANDRGLPSVTASDYLQNCNCCPTCGDSDIEGDNVSLEEGLASQPIMCLSCDASWRDVYVLAGFDQLMVETPSEEG